MEQTTGSRVAPRPVVRPAKLGGMLLAVLLAVGSVADAADERRVLLLYAYHPSFPTTAPVLEGLQSVLEDVEIDVEYMDSKRVHDERSLTHFTSLLAYKLAKRPRYDLVVVSDDNALDFALRNHDTILGGVPIVFLGVNDLEKAVALDGNPRITGVIEKVSLRATIELARQLDPDLRRVVAVVDDTPSGRGDRASLEGLGRRVAGTDIVVLSLGERSWSEAAEQLRGLGPHDAVLRLAAFRDRDGTVLSKTEAVALMVASAPVPVYTMRVHDLGSGMLGGVVVSFLEQGRAAGEMARRILDGAPPGSIPVVRRSPNRPTVDHAVMQRFGLEERQLPEGSVVLNRPLSFVRQYALLAGTTLAVIATLVVLVAYLSWQIVARKRMESSLRKSEERFRTMVEGSVYGVLIHRNREPLFANQAYADILGYDSPESILALGSTERIYAPHEHERMRAYQMNRVAGRDAPSEYEIDAIAKDGTTIVLHNVVHATTWAGAFATQHNVIDVTARRRADELRRESEERYRTLVENAPEAIVVLDADTGCFVEANENALRLFKLDRERLFEADPAELSPVEQPDGRPSAEAAMAYVEAALAGETPIFAWTHRDADGNEIPTEIRLVRLPAAGRRLVRGSITDVTAREIARRTLEEKSTVLEATFENIEQGISMIDTDLRVVEFNQRFLELLDFPRDRFAPGDPFEKFIRFNAERGEYGPGDVDALVAERVGLAAQFRPHRFVRTRPDGTVIEIHGKQVPGGGFVTTYTDITETHRLSEQLSHQARHDALTDLLNRREFEDRLATALESTREGGASHAMCYLDLDQFKVINDTCGHIAGDELLRRLGQTLRTCMRKRDTLARLGGDEFGVLLEDCPLPEAQRVAGALRSAVEEFRFSWENYSFRVGVSIGLVPVTAESGSVTDVLSAADSACYAAKDQGRNRIHLYHEDDADLARRHGEMQWVVRIQHALDEHRFRLDLQPIVAIDASAAEGEHFELLLRMEDEAGATIAPGAFLPAAERYDLIGRLDRWVVSAALAALSDSRSRLDRLFLCSINLSGHSLADDDFATFIHEQFSYTRVPPSKVCFEVTETAAIANLAQAAQFMGELRSLGCRFALDDFGSGLSSFAYLKTLPVDFLKIDGIFVKDIVEDPIDHAMVKSINEIGHVMGKRTIAEFVEDAAILDALRAIGVDYAQGYGIGRPRPLAESRWLRAAS